jgi:hypothetical protein
MNGGLAKRMFDQETINNIGKTVAIDHYIADANEMGEFIDYFYSNFGAKVTIGEWGAPIPEINGAMDEKSQATFINSLLWKMYIRRDIVEGINYWVLYDSSTALLNNDYSPKEVVEIIN